MMKRRIYLKQILAGILLLSLILGSVPTIGAIEAPGEAEYPEVPIDLSEWILSDAYYDEANGYVVLTKDYADWQAGSIWYNRPYEGDFTLEMDYYTGSTDRALNGADGIAVAFYANYIYKAVGGEEMGFNGCDGYGIELDTYYNSNRSDPQENHIALIRKSVGDHLVTASLPESEDEQWHHLRLTVEDGSCSAYVDGTLKFTHAVEATGYGWIGITAATGDGQNLHAVKNIQITGKDSGGVPGRFLDMILSNESTDEEDTYEITAEITNLAKVKAPGVTVTMELPELLSIDETKTLSVALGDLEPGITKTATWIVHAQQVQDDTIARYSVTATLDAGASLKQEDYLFLEGTRQTGAGLTVQDRWSFSNSADHFTDGTGVQTESGFIYNDRYFLLDRDREALVHGLSPIERDLIEKTRRRNWGGSCYGMSATAILVKLGVIQLKDVPTGPSSLSAANKVNDDALESFINFYMLQQRCTAPMNAKSTFSLLPTSEQLAVIEGLAQKGDPFMLCFGGDGWGHAVVGYGIEYGAISYGNKEYDARVLVYDCNHPTGTPESHLYFNVGSDEWTIANYDATELVMACGDVAILDSVNYGIASSNQVARLEFISQSKGYYLVIDQGEKVFVDEAMDLREKGLVTFHYADLMADGTYVQTPMVATLPELAGDYTIYPDATKSTDFTMYYENSALAISCDSVGQIDLGANDWISARHIRGDYSLSMTFDEGHHSTPFYQTMVSGSTCTEISMQQTKDGIVIRGDDLSDAQIQVEDDTGIQTIKVPEGTDSVMVTSKEDQLYLWVDLNDDGVFEDPGAATYRIEFDPNGGTGTMEALNDHPGGDYRLPACTFVAPEGKAFAGWALSKDGAPLASTSCDINEDTTLYAIWQDILTPPAVEPTVETQTQPEDVQPEDSSSAQRSRMVVMIVSVTAAMIVIVPIVIVSIVLLLRKRK